jgi:hypothetical protein
LPHTGPYDCVCVHIHPRLSSTRPEGCAECVGRASERTLLPHRHQPFRTRLDYTAGTEVSLVCTTEAALVATVEPRCTPESVPLGRRPNEPKPHRSSPPTVWSLQAESSRVDSPDCVRSRTFVRTTMCESMHRKMLVSPRDANAPKQRQAHTRESKTPS